MFVYRSFALTNYSHVCVFERQAFPTFWVLILLELGLCALTKPKSAAGNYSFADRSLLVMFIIIIIVVSPFWWGLLLSKKLMPALVHLGSWSSITAGNLIFSLAKTQSSTHERKYRHIHTRKEKVTLKMFC